MLNVLEWETENGRNEKGTRNSPDRWADLLDLLNDNIMYSSGQHIFIEGFSSNISRIASERKTIIERKHESVLVYGSKESRENAVRDIER